MTARQVSSHKAALAHGAVPVCDYLGNKVADSFADLAAERARPFLGRKDEIAAIDNDALLGITSLNFKYAERHHTRCRRIDYDWQQDDAAKSKGSLQTDHAPHSISSWPSSGPYGKHS